jgi:acyl transferase domain-containing protein/NAD(P)-dependent dehydrogenase (short-subunit alcohol dehydrogenase family)
MSRYDIAIIGMGCVLPKANSVEQYWKNIVKGDSYVSKMPTSLWHLDSFYSADKSAVEKTYTTDGAFIEGFEFPYLEYKLPPNTLKGVDPAQLVTIDATRQALDDAGYEVRDPRLENGVTIIGASGVDQYAHASLFLKRYGYFKRLRSLLEARGVSTDVIDTLDREFAKELSKRGHFWNPAIASVGAITSSISNRIAQVFGVKGFNMTVDAACASSFVALDVGCHALMSGDANIVLAGGADLGTNPAIYIGFSRVDGLSINGHTNPFDHSANGLVIGEGVGMVVLKRLEDAIKDGDRIRSVIRGVGSSSDGAGQAIYAPSVQGRVEALRAGLNKAKTLAGEVQYLEAHATSTIVGDGNEYDTISSVYSPGRDTKDPLYIGSVKHQIGHLKAAAGVAGLIKTVLAMENAKIPHMPRFTKLTPEATMPSDAIAIPTTMQDWAPRADGMRVAAVTSSGFGGVNYHYIVEQGDTYKVPDSRPVVSHEIAIVGTACKVAGADNVDQFWKNMTEGVDLFVDADPKELGWEDLIDPATPGEKITTRKVSRLGEVSINLLKHKIFPNAVSQIAPTQLLGLDLSDQLLENAGFDYAVPKKVGVSIGAMHDDYFDIIFSPMSVDEYGNTIAECPVTKKIDKKILQECIEGAGQALKDAGPPVTEHTLPGWMSNVTAGRIANKLNLHGPNFTVDTACSSGLAALLPATYQLMFGDVDAMISGGLNRQLDAPFTCGVCALGAVAKDDARPYDAQGQGFLIGEGGVLFLLRRLADAKRDGDTILAVIHGVDGSSEADSKTMVAPTEEAVRRAIRRTLDKSGIDPDDIGVSETHGSANPLSDIVEARSLAAELRSSDSDNPVQILAVKSHIGHLYGGSGASSLLTTIQTLKTGTLPGIRRLETVRPEIAELGGRVEPRKGTIKLSSKAKAGAVNSLGLGGANYFTVVTVPDDQHTTTKKSAPRTTPRKSKIQSGVRAEDEVNDIFVCVAEDEKEMAGALGRAVQQSPIPQFVSEGNDPQSRLAVTFTSQDELKTKLSNALRMFEGGHGIKPLESQGVFAAAYREDTAPQKLAFCFPGQGTHYISMGAHLYETNPEFQKIVDQVDGLSRRAFNFDLLAHIFGDEDDSDNKKRLGTLVGAQTALFAIELGMAKVLEGMNVIPDVMVGHSFGEISALTVAGVWDVETAYEVVKARIKSAELVIKGGGPALGMMSVICSDEQRDAILSLVEDKVVLSNINAPGRFVCAGMLDAVKRTVSVAESFGVEARVLPIGAAFHSRYMEPAREPFRKALLKLPCSKPRIPIMSTVTGEYIDMEGLTTESLADHLSTQFITQLNLPREISRLYDDGVRHFLEVGPGWSMTKMIASILEKKPFRSAPTLHPKVGDVETFRRARAFLMALGHFDSAAERKNLPGMFSPDFQEYLEAEEPAILSLIAEVHMRYLAKMQNRSVRESVLLTTKSEPVLSGTTTAVDEKTAAADDVPVVPAPATAVPATGADIEVWVKRVRNKLVTTTGYPEEMLEVDLDLEADLGVDSVQRAELWVALTIEYKLDTEVRPKGIRTIAQFAQSLAEMAGPTKIPMSPVVDVPSDMPAPAAGVVGAEVWVERVRAKLVATTGYPEEMLEVGLDLEADLGVDSVQRAEIWVALTTEYNMDDEVRPKGIRTIAQFAESLAEMTGPVAVTASSTKIEPTPTPAASKAADAQVWIDRVRAKLVATTGYPEEMLEVGLDLEADLGVDSVQRAEIWVALTTEYNMDTEVRPKGIRTIAQFSEALVAMTENTAGSTEATAETKTPVLSSDPISDDTGLNRLFISSFKALDESAMEPFDCKKVVCIVAKKDGWIPSFKGRLTKRGIEATMFTPREILAKENKELQRELSDADTLIYLAHQGLASSENDGAALSAAFTLETKTLFSVFRTLVPSLEKQGLRIIIPVSRDGAFGCAGTEVPRMLGAFPAGFARSLVRELPSCRFQIIDAGEISWADVIGRQLHVVSSHFETGATGLGFVEPTVAPVAAPLGEDRQVLDKGDLVVVTGGARGIVFECVLELARRTGCRIVLTGRTELAKGNPKWLSSAPDQIDSVIREMEIGLVRSSGMKLGEAKRVGSKTRSQWELGRNLNRMREAGVDAQYEVCDVSDSSAFAVLVKKLARKDVVRGVVHGAGIQRSKIIGELTDEAVALTLDTKLNPLFALIDVLDWSQLKLLLGFGSITGLFGNVGQTDYALGNDMLTWMIAQLGQQYPQMLAQTIEWTAWTGTGMVTNEEAKRFKESGLTPLDIESGVNLFIQGVLGTTHRQLAAFNAGAAFGSGRKIVDQVVGGVPVKKLLTTEGDIPRARFSLKQDLYLKQHLVQRKPVVPGTFVSEILAEAVRGENLDILDVHFRRPLGVREEGFEVEVLRDGKSAMVLPVDRPQLEAKAMGNLAFSTCTFGPSAQGDAAQLKFAAADVEALIAATGDTKGAFYTALDEKFSDALATGPIFRGIRSTIERNGTFFGALEMTPDALACCALDGEFVFNPVLADMAVQVACAWGIQKLDVMAIPAEIGRLHSVAAASRRNSIVICKAIEFKPEEMILDVAVRELDGRLILTMDRLILRTIAGLDN